jgi:hypothetical protein
MKNEMAYCDGCGKQRRDVRAMGRDYNGDPDAPGYCFICRKEGERRRIWHNGRYMSVDEFDSYH